MRIVITGADGFIARNLHVRLRELGHTDIVAVTRRTTPGQFETAFAGAEFVFHLAGVNRPQEEREFRHGNTELTESICAALASGSGSTPVVFASSTQAPLENPYGRSKAAAEQVLLRYAHRTGAPVHLFRLPNVFGKWCRPHYNSAVATFCHLIARGQPVTIHDPAARLRLVHVDDVVIAFTRLLESPDAPGGYADVQPAFDTTVGEVAQMLKEFATSRATLVTPRVGTGLVRALYATYVSYLPPEAFVYDVPRHSDPRGVFVEMLKTPDCGQFSYFTAHPGVTRGGHYHHAKTEKFLVMQGTARFAFRNVDSGQTHEVVVRGGEGRIVESIPGWAHDITNTGENELIVMLWASEIFDHSRPDTISMQVAS